MFLFHCSITDSAWLWCLATQSAGPAIACRRDRTTGLSGGKNDISDNTALMKLLLSARMGFRQRRPWVGAFPIQVMPPYPGSVLKIPRVSYGSHNFVLSEETVFWR